MFGIKSSGFPTENATIVLGREHHERYREQRDGFMGVGVEVIEVVAEDEVVDAESAGQDHGHRRVVTVDNKDNAETLRLRVPVTVTVESVIETMYGQFRITRGADDRLTCRGNGEDVYQYGARTLAQYLDEGHCHDLHWVFVGGTGGA
jgi:hypothetical protein